MGIKEKLHQFGSDEKPAANSVLTIIGSPPLYPAVGGKARISLLTTAGQHSARRSSHRINVTKGILVIKAPRKLPHLQMS